MGRRGPKTTPVSLKILRGNTNKEGLGAVAARMPKSAGELTDPPPDLEGVALDKWNATVPMLSTMRVWSSDARETWARYCRTYALWKLAIEFIEKNGQVFETPSGIYKSRPETILCRGYSADLLRIEQCFGLVPSAKQSVTVQDAAVDPMDAFLREAQ